MTTTAATQRAPARDSATADAATPEPNAAALELAGARLMGLRDFCGPDGHAGTCGEYRTELLRLRGVWRSWQTWNDARGSCSGSFDPADRLPPVDVPSDDECITDVERLAVEIAAAHAAPSQEQLLALVGADADVVSTAGVDRERAAAAPRWWMLFACSVEGLDVQCSALRSALSFIPPLELALAVRGLDPDVTIAKRGALDARRAAAAKRVLRRLSPLLTGDVAKELSDDFATLFGVTAPRFEHAMRSPEETPVFAPIALQTLAATVRTLAATSSDSADDELTALDAYLKQHEATGDAGKLPTWARNAVRASRELLWDPVFRTLKESALGLRPQQMVSIALADVWLADLVPILRLREKHSKGSTFMLDAVDPDR